ncbi:hypothetical protein AAAX96_19425 [Butyricimonas faecihominis]|uniref:hypothetical protein n=1 Tax=Butyricimonas faecihominis TaxID=1472416 RepID=UPI0032BF9AA1
MSPDDNLNELKLVTFYNSAKSNFDVVTNIFDFFNKDKLLCEANKDNLNLLYLMFKNLGRYNTNYSEYKNREEIRLIQNKLNKVNIQNLSKLKEYIITASKFYKLLDNDKYNEIIEFLDTKKFIPKETN